MPSLFKKLPFILLTLAILSLNTPVIAANNCTGDECDEAGALLITTTTGPTTTVAAGIVVTIMMMGGNNSASREAYLRQNAVALKQDITVGAGESIDDLAAAFQVSDDNRSAFAAAIHAQRAALLPLTDVATLDEKRADAFFEVVANTMNQTPALHRDFRQIAQTI